MTPEQAAAVVQAGSSGGSANIAEESPLQVGGAITDAGMGRDDFTAVAKLGKYLKKICISIIQILHPNLQNN